MSEEAPTYFVRDFCAVCEEELKPAPHGGKYACHPVAEVIGGIASQSYWSEAVPTTEDLRGFIQLTGNVPRMRTEAYRVGEETVHMRKPQFLYRRMGA